MGLLPGLDAIHVAQALGEGRGSQADLVVAIMGTKGTGRVDFYEVRKSVNICCLRKKHEPMVQAVAASDRGI